MKVNLLNVFLLTETLLTFYFGSTYTLLAVREAVWGRGRLGEAVQAVVGGVWRTVLAVGGDRRQKTARVAKGRAWKTMLNGESGSL